MAGIGILLRTVSFKRIFMALKPCRECRAMVSTKATFCPKCGVPKPVPAKKHTWALVLFCIIVFFVWLAPKSKEPSIAATSPRQTKVSGEAFPGCLTTRANAGGYVSSDGGKSALRLIGDCKEEWNSWIDLCMANGRTDSNCTVTAGIMAQTAIKLVESGLVTEKAKPTSVPFEVSFEVGMDFNDRKPVIRVRTNLPENTEFMSEVSSPINEGGKGYFAQAKAAVSPTGFVEFGPFTNHGEALQPGKYRMTIETVMAAMQPENVRTVFGQNGENLTGNKVSKLRIGSEKGISQSFVFKVHQDGTITVQ